MVIIRIHLMISLAECIVRILEECGVFMNPAKSYEGQEWFPVYTSDVRIRIRIQSFLGWIRIRIRIQS